MFNKTDVNYIIYLLNRMKEESTDLYQIKIESTNYIINQLIRQLKIPKENWHITYKADILWKQITNDNIENYSYQAKVTLIKSDELSLDTFKGNSKKEENKPFKRGEFFEYRKVFHDEHIMMVAYN